MGPTDAGHVLWQLGFVHGLLDALRAARHSLDVWGGPGGATVGCAAMEQSNIETLITWLDPKKKPVVVLLPRKELRALRGAWGLPAVPK